MQKKITNENFEDFIKQNADGLRLTPSVKAWKGIEKKLKRGNRWTTIIASAFLLTASLFGYLTTEHTKGMFKIKAVTPTDNTENNHTETTLAKVISISKNKTASNKQPINQSVNKEAGTLLSFIGSQNSDNDVIDDFVGAPTSTGSLNNPILNTVSLPQDKLPEATINLLLKPSNSIHIENVDKAVKAIVKKKKTEIELFFTPTVSYRKLSENKSYLRSMPTNGFSFASYYDVKNVVTHRPNIGLEFGFSAKYRIARALQLRGGVQFNVNGYEIKAFDNVPELVTISLNNRSNVQSVNTISNYRNFNGGQSDWIKNSYFQISAPIGLELKLKGSDKVKFGVASTVQPTYMLSENAYLISTDYKNYSKVPTLMRRWNVNTSVETFVGYSTGKLKWQVGPQIRYQLLSSSVAKYPVKENLIDVGLKVGVSLNNK